MPVKELGSLVRWQHRKGVLYLQFQLPDHGMNCCVSIDLLIEEAETTAGCSLVVLGTEEAESYSHYRIGWTSLCLKDGTKSRTLQAQLKDQQWRPTVLGSDCWQNLEDGVERTRAMERDVFCHHIWHTEDIQWILIDSWRGTVVR